MPHPSHTPTESFADLQLKPPNADVDTTQKSNRIAICSETAIEYELLSNSTELHDSSSNCIKQCYDNSLRRGVAKLVKASDFDSDMRGFESFLPCHSLLKLGFTTELHVCPTPSKKAVFLVHIRTL